MHRFLMGDAPWIFLAEIASERCHVSIDYYGYASDGPQSGLADADRWCCGDCGHLTNEPLKPEHKCPRCGQAK
jgi:hypothetical protein